ncbi:hypothetical protein EDB19DRAFT_1835756 [Suillus lakei]|nr:hypothetical protein EDB19DRAFT_1835756 [Suillus lakei]
MGKFAGAHWAFVHGVHHIGNGIVVVGDGVAGVCASAGANDKDGGVNAGEGDLDGGVGVKAGGGVSAGCMKIGIGDVTCMTLLLLLGVESSMCMRCERGVGGLGKEVQKLLPGVKVLGMKMLIVACAAPNCLAPPANPKSSVYCCSQSLGTVVCVGILSEMGGYIWPPQGQTLEFDPERVGMPDLLQTLSLQYITSDSICIDYENSSKPACLHIFLLLGPPVGDQA